ncbi:MAG: DUF2087 domain-containing protein [Acutalibacter sp.]
MDASSFFAGSSTTPCTLSIKRCSSAAFWTSGEKSSDAQRQQERRLTPAGAGQLLSTAAQVHPCPAEEGAHLPGGNRQRAELGCPYPERELNQVLLRFHKDYCTLRRDMISEVSSAGRRALHPPCLGRKRPLEK